MANNSHWKGEKCKEFKVKGWKLQRIHPQRVKNEKNTPLRKRIKVEP